MEKEKKSPQQNVQPIFTIKDTLYDIDEVYFEELMVQLGEYLCERYNEIDVVSPLELMSQIAYVNDLSIQQKMYLGYFLGAHSNNLDYEGLILQCLNKKD